MNNAIGTAAENKAELALVRVFVGQISGVPANVCDARELHAYLEAGRDFTTWLNERIEKYGFEENRDFALVPRNGGIKKGRGGDRRSKDYHLSLDMAKELGMVENNERGRGIRRYFIECEKRLREIAPNEADTILNATIGTDGFTMLGSLIKGKVTRLPTAVRRRAAAKLWSQTHAAFGVRSAADIPTSQLDAARNFIAAYAIEGEFLGKAPSDPDSLVFTPREASALYWLMNSHHHACRIMREDGIYRLARKVDSTPLFNMISHLLDPFIGSVETLENRLEEIYRLAEKAGSRGGYAMKMFANSPIR